MLFLLILYYNLNHNKHDLDNQYILDHFEEIATTKVKLDGVIKNVDNTNHILLIRVGSRPEDIILVSTTEPLNTTQQNDVVEVYGSFTSRTHMTAEKLLINQRWKHDLIFIRSLPAIPFTLYLFFRTWRFSRKTYHFERRKNHA